MTPFVRAALGCLLALSSLESPAWARPPEQGKCPSVTGDAGSPRPPELVDAAPLILAEGMLVQQDDLPALIQLVPEKIWQHREVFFHEGMRLEIGSCHRRYPTADFYREATTRFAGSATVDEDGNLRNYTAGLPFPPDHIDPESDSLAAAKWAWNLAHRYRGAGHRGRFRITDMPSRLGSTQVYEGEFFFLQTRHRADLPESGYSVPGAGDKLWAAGGRFYRPFGARHLAWRQFRNAESLTRYQTPDDTFVYVPAMRKMRRSPANWVDGVFFPRYTLTGDDGGGGIPLDGSGAINPKAGSSIAVSQDANRGVVGLTLRPNAYVWRYLGERDVLAPLNTNRPGYPDDPSRNFGASGLSAASDRWDVRRAVVIEGAMKAPGQSVRTLEIFVDYQTQQPLYWITRGDRRRVLDIGILIHRFSGDVAGYPPWPGNRPPNVFEPVAAVFFNNLEGAGGWRRESYDLRCLPFSPGERRALTSADNLGKGH